MTMNPSGLSPWWRHSLVITLIVGLTVLIWLAVRTYQFAPPIPDKVIGPGGETILTADDIRAGQEVFLKYGLMENGSVWGHGAYLGPDFSAEYLHALAVAAGPALKQNRYDSDTRILPFTEAEATVFEEQVARWTAYFTEPTGSVGLPARYITDPTELRQLTAFFAWTAWASVANRPDKSYSYTNNFPYEPLAGNTVTADAILWSALSLIALLAGIAGVLVAFGKFDFLGWKGGGRHVHPTMLPGVASESQRATIKLFAIVALLFLVQAIVGAVTAHYRAEPGKFYGIDLAQIAPSHIMRTWHLQLAIFWIATAYVAGGLFLAAALGNREVRGQVQGINLLCVALLVVVVGSLLGEWLGVNQVFGPLWFWLGHQGWEYLDLGRAWQVLLVAGLLLWFVLLVRAMAPARQNPTQRQVILLFQYAALAIPLFYLPAMFFGSTTHLSVVDNWRFWIVHLWVEGFLELFVTVMVALIFLELGVMSHTNVARVVYLDAILYLGSGIIGTGHHWYWTGQTTITMALSAVFSAMEVVPLTLLTLDAWDFIKLTRSQCGVCELPVSLPHKWTFYFLMAVGFWNFVGAGVFGFLINLPVVSFYEVGTILTSNHGHTAMMGVFGMLALALMVIAFRQVLDDQQWYRVEKYVRVSFWGLNIGLALMVILSLFPGGVLQLWDVLTNGYWHARGPEFMNQPFVRLLEWLRLPGDAVFIAFGAVPMALAALLTWRFTQANRRRQS
ncbi:nitric-oxide reductase [Candidatus Methylomirabilis lanthanidiphila]|uniref:Nitric-oxide reductase n=1 Tax=Candidatus Methylomirabilis lanthanidiphila TaxID=2211376 RepID=A0A564ZHD0_9BACT|nr:cbb3-type cytochrome c oxidase subunit I [Candidatus Methylomirabilis lanthanidiphila]VUZ84563.1 nitric-oxide reductase [Candidatus Methylomirabilis lanthanidiphila]